MIITISGLHGTGKSTIGKKIASLFNLKYYSTGQVFRELAREYGMDLEEFTKHAEKNSEIDRELDDKILHLAQQNNIIIDSQLSAFILNNIADFKILLTCSIETRVKRMAERDRSSIQEKMKETLLREKSEEERYKKLYDIDLNNPKILEETYDLILDTTYLEIEQVMEEILKFFKKK